MYYSYGKPCSAYMKECDILYYFAAIEHLLSCKYQKYLYLYSMYTYWPGQ